MRHQLATKLLCGVGASTHFVDDVLGDLEELAAQRRAAGQSCGRAWYAGEVLRSVPHAVRESVSGSARACLVDVAQKALSAWLLVGAAACGLLVVLMTGYDAFSARFEALPHWARWLAQDSVRSASFFLLVVLTISLRWALLGYLTVWMDSRRPLVSLLAVAACEAYLMFVFVDHNLTGVERLFTPALAWSLVMCGGVWRVLRGRLSPSPTAAPVATR